MAAGLAGCGVGNINGLAGGTEKPIKKHVDGDLVYFNSAENRPGAGKGVREALRRQGPRVVLRLDVGDDGQAAGGHRLRRDLPERRVRPAPAGGQPAAQVDRDKIKNIDTVYSYFADPWYDKGSEHTTPYGMYATGLGYRADKVTGMTGSWRDLGEADSGDRSFLLDDYQEAIGMANLVNGYPLNEVDTDKLEQSKDYLVDLKPKLRGISADTTTNMVSGNAWIQHLWNGDIVNIRSRSTTPRTTGSRSAGGAAGRQRQLRDPGQRGASGTALLFIEYMLEPEMRPRTSSGSATRCPTRAVPPRRSRGS